MSASRRVERPTEKASQSSASDGSFCPGFHWLPVIISMIWFATCSLNVIVDTGFTDGETSIVASAFLRCEFLAGPLMATLGGIVVFSISDVCQADKMRVYGIAGPTFAAAMLARHNIFGHSRQLMRHPPHYLQGSRSAPHSAIAQFPKALNPNCDLLPRLEPALRSTAQPHACWRARADHVSRLQGHDR